jgi:hypothetical protein
MKKQCSNCLSVATLSCCWVNTENGKPPYRYVALCEKCAQDTFEKVNHQDFWINLPLNSLNEKRSKDIPRNSN